MTYTLDDLREMSDADLSALVARLVGWEHHGMTYHHVGRGENRGAWYDSNLPLDDQASWTLTNEPPSYATDLNLALSDLGARIEKAGARECCIFGNELAKIVGGSPSTFQMVNATARQRSIAFVLLAQHAGRKWGR